MADGLRGRFFWEEPTSDSTPVDELLSPPITEDQRPAAYGSSQDLLRGFASASRGLEAGSLHRRADELEVEGRLDKAAAVRDEARRYEAAAAKLSPRVSSFQDVQGVGDAVDYLQGGLGTLAPTMGPPLAAGLAGAAAGAAVAGPLGIGPGIAAGLGGAAAASVPAFQMEAGEQASSQQADDYIRENTTAEERLREQNIKGLQNAALESLFPAVFGGRVVGRAARRIAGEALAKSPLRRTAAVAREGAIESGTELTQTLTGQASLSRMNPNRDTTHDYVEQIDSIILGALGGTSISLGTTVPGYAAERIGQRLGREADAGARALGRGTERLLRDIQAEVPLSQAGEGAEVPLGVKRSLQYPELSDEDAKAFSVIADRYQRALTIGDEGLIAQELERGKQFLKRRNPVYSAPQENILARGAIEGQNEYNTLTLGRDDEGRQITYDVAMRELPDRYLPITPVPGTQGLAKFRQRHVLRGEEDAFKQQLKNEGFISESGVDAAQTTPLGDYLREVNAAPEEVQAEAESMLRDIRQRLRGASGENKQKLETQRQALESAETYGDYYDALNEYSVVRFPPSELEGRFTPRDAAAQQISLAKTTDAQDKKKLVDNEVIKVRLGFMKDGKPTGRVRGRPRQLVKSDIIAHAREFFRDELATVPEARRDDVALRMGVFADPRVVGIMHDGKLIKQEDINLENPAHRAALKLPPLTPDRRRFAREDPYRSREASETGYPEEQTSAVRRTAGRAVDTTEQPIDPDVARRQPEGATGMPFSTPQEQRRIARVQRIQAAQELQRQNPGMTIEEALAQIPLEPVAQTGAGVAAAQRDLRERRATQLDVLGSDTDSMEYDRVLQAAQEVEDLTIRRRQLEERLDKIQNKRSPVARRLNAQIGQITSQLVRYWDDYGASLGNVGGLDLTVASDAERFRRFMAGETADTTLLEAAPAQRPQARPAGRPQAPPVQGQTLPPPRRPQAPPVQGVRRDATSRKQSKQYSLDDIPSNEFRKRLGKRLKEQGLQILQDPDSDEYYVADKDGNRLDEPTDELKKSMQMAGEEAPAITTREEAERWLVRAFGEDMRDENKLGWMFGRDMDFAAGDYNQFTDFMRLALDAHDPLSVAFHEGMHKFVAQLKDSNPALYDRMVKAANAPHVIKQMEKILRDLPSGFRAIDQIRAGLQSEDPAIVENGLEEVVAYAFQLYAANREGNGPKLNIQPSLKQIFRKIMESFARVLGVMTHARATEQIFDALYTGRVRQEGLESLAQFNERSFKEYSQDVTKALKETVPSVVSSPIIRLQHMSNEEGNPISAFKQLANAWYSEPLKGGPSGVIQRQSQMEGQYRNRWRKILQDHNVTREELRSALLNFQSMQEPRNDFEWAVKHFFDQMFEYSQQGENPVKVLTLVDPETGRMEWLPPNRVERYFPRIWSPENIRANEIEFREVMQRHSDMTDEQITTFIELMSATDGLEAGSELQRYRADFSPFQAAINARQFDFINESNAAEFAKFQEQDMAKIMDRYIRQAVHRREHSRTFGHNGKRIDDLLQLARAQGANDRQIAYAEKVVQGLEGRLGTDKVSDLMREAQVTAMSIVNFAVLPLALFSSMVDPLGTMVRTGSMKEAFNTFKGGFRQIFNDTRGVESPDQALAEYLGIIEEDMAQDILNNTERGLFVNEKLRRVNQFFFKSIGLEQWTRGTRIAALRAGIEYLKANANNAEALAELGLEVGQIIPTDTATGIAVKPEEFAPGNAAAGRENARRVQNALYRMVDESILRPSAGTRPLWMSDMRFLLLGHLKQFTFTFHNTILRQLITKAGNQENMAKAALTFAPLLSYVPVMIAADMARDAFRGKEDDDRELDEIVYRAVQRSAILGMGTFLMDIERDAEYGDLPTNTVLGPVIDSALNVGRAAVNPDASLTKAGAKLLPYNAVWRNWGKE